MRKLAFLTAAALTLAAGVAYAQPVTPDLLPPEAFHNWTYQGSSATSQIPATSDHQGLVQTQGRGR